MLFLCLVFIGSKSLLFLIVIIGFCKNFWILGFFIILFSLFFIFVLSCFILFFIFFSFGDVVFKIFLGVKNVWLIWVIIFFRLKSFF